MSINFSKYENIKLLTEQENSKIFLVLGKEDKKYYIIKEIKNKENVIIIEDEAKKLSTFNSKYIVKYYASSWINDNFYILMEYIEGKNLMEYINQYENENKKIPEPTLYNIIIQICSGIKEIHDKNIVHRDLKPENIILNEYDDIKIIDFGISKSIIPNTINPTSNRAGTHHYTAPEVLFKGIYNQKSDIYQLGCIFYRLFVQRDYYADKLCEEIEKINEEFYDDNWQILMNSLLETKLDKRLDINQVIDFINKRFSYLKILFEFNKRFNCNINNNKIEEINICDKNNDIIELFDKLEFKNLKNLILTNNALFNINSLKNLKSKNLLILNLSGNKIADINKVIL